MASGKLSETLNWYSSCKIASLMILRSSRILLEVLAGLLFVLVLLGAGAAWRLSQGPVSLAFAIPYVDEQLVKAGGPFAIELVDIILIWGGWDRTLDIRVVGVTARDRGGGVIAAIPEVSVGLAAVALAGGKISLTRFELIEPLMRAHRTESGEFELVIGERTGPTGNTLPMLFQALLNPHERESPLAVLNQISVVGGKLVVDDRMLRTTWRARGVDIVLTRNEAGLSARFGLEAGAVEPARIGRSHQISKLVVDDRMPHDLAGPRRVSVTKPALARREATLSREPRILAKERSLSTEPSRVSGRTDWRLKFRRWRGSKAWPFRSMPSSRSE